MMKNTAYLIVFNTVSWWLFSVVYFFGPPCIHVYSARHPCSPKTKRQSFVYTWTKCITKHREERGRMDVHNKI